MSLAERLKQAMEEAGLKQPELARLSHSSQQHISKILTGLARHPKNMVSIAEAVAKPVEWLLYGIDVNHKRYLYTLPLFSPATVLGYQSESDPTSVDENSPIQERIVMCNPGYEQCYAVKVESDLVTQPTGSDQTIYAGDTLLIDPSKEPQNNEIVLAHQEGAPEGFFKRFVTEGIGRYLVALKTPLPPLELSEKIKILGVVVAKIPPLVALSSI